MDGAPKGEVPGSAEQVRRLLAGHQPADGKECAAMERIGSELDRLADPCDEHADLVHVTASAIVVGRRGTLLHRHRRLLRWMQPGGHIDPGEAPWEAALRESEEETGLVLSHPPGGPVLVHVDVHQGAQGHTHLDLRYVLLGPDADPRPPPGESPEARWFEWDEAQTMSADLDGALSAARRWTAEEATHRDR